MESAAILIIQLVSGGVGGLAAGKIGPELSLGTIGDIVAGIVGGVGFGQMLNFFGVGVSSGGSLNVSAILLNILMSAVGGLSVMLVVAVLKKLLSKW